MYVYTVEILFGLMLITLNLVLIMYWIITKWSAYS